MTRRFPIIIRTDDKSGSPRIRATTSVERLAQPSRGVERDLRAVELDYAVTLAAVKEALAQAARPEHRHDPRAYWLAGGAILSLVDRMSENGFYLVRQNATLARDLGLAEVSVRKVVAFRRRFPRISDVDPSIPWAKYRDNRVPVPGSASTTHEQG